MKKITIALLIVMTFAIPCIGQTFHLKQDKTGEVYGPFELKDGERITIQTTSFTIVTGKAEATKPEPTASLIDNSIMVIMPYRYVGTWVFDDPIAGLEKEPFIAGIPEIIDKLVKDIPDAQQGFRLLFSASPFPGHTHKMEWKKVEDGGNWYYSKDFKMEGWLCPSLFKYFKAAPKNIYVKAEEKLPPSKDTNATD